MTRSPIKLLAPAKVNLFLHLISKRKDNYHNIESLFAFTDFGDEITVTVSETLSLELCGPFANDLPSGENIVLKAAEELKKLAEINSGAKIVLEKNLPIASGVGGGSSDAAATIKALTNLWEINVSEEKLANVALKLGADVPACLRGTPQFVSGIGEKMQPVNGLKEFNCILINPNIPVSTPKIFNSFDGVFKNPIIKTEREIVNFRDKSNDLERIAIKIFPQINDTLEILKSLTGCTLVRMSGSGATCFGIFDNELNVLNAVNFLKKETPNWWIASGKILGSK